MSETIALEPKKITNGFSQNKMDAIFNHPDCFKIFSDRIKEVRIEDNEDTRRVMYAYSKLAMKVPKKQLNLSDDELTNLAECVTNGNAQMHTGILLLIMKMIATAPPEDYCTGLPEFVAIAHSCTAVQKQIEAASNPLRDEVVEQFYLDATEDQLDEIKAATKQMDAQQNNGAMPGNGNIPQYNFGQR